MVKRQTSRSPRAPVWRYGSGVSRRARQVGYTASGLLMVVGGILGVALSGAAAALSSLAVIGLGVVLASTIVYLDLVGGDQPEEVLRAAERERSENEARRRIEAKRRAVEREQELERERERQRERHDAMAGASGHHARPRRLRSRDPRRPN